MIFKLNRKVEKGERNDEMTRRTKSKAIKSINLNVQHVNEMTYFDLALNVRLLDTLEYISVLLSSRDTTVNGVLC